MIFCVFGNTAFLGLKKSKQLWRTAAPGGDSGASVRFLFREISRGKKASLKLDPPLGVHHKDLVTWENQA